jgi:ATP-dependent DNA helicase RecG
MTPPVRAEVSVEAFEGARVVLAIIDGMAPRDKPCYVTQRGMYKGSFIRTGDGDRRLPYYEVDRLLEERSQPKHDARLVGDAAMGDLDPLLLNGMLLRQRGHHPRVFGDLSEEEALLALRVAAKDEAGVARPALAGLLALGKYPQRHFPRLLVAFAAYPGVDKAGDPRGGGPRLLSGFNAVGAIPAMVADAVAWVTRNMRTESYIRGAFRTETTEYPLIAVREAVANALMHRDYSEEACGSPVQVDLYQDRLEIRNPGGLYGAVTVGSLGEPGVSAARNQHLAALLEYTPFPEGGAVVENRGSGYQAIQRSLSDASLPAPIPLDTLRFFSLTFRNGGQGGRPGAGGGDAGRRRASPGGGVASVQGGQGRQGGEYMVGESERAFGIVQEEPARYATPIDPSRAAKGAGLGAGVVPAYAGLVAALIERNGGKATARHVASGLGVSRSFANYVIRALVKGGLVAPTKPKHSPSQEYVLAPRRS